MEINKINGDIVGVVAGQDIVEGSMVFLKGAGSSYDFGARTDLPKAILPTSADEAKRARFVMTWQVNNVKMPMLSPMPAFTFALRKGGWDQAANLPLTGTTVYTTYPGNQNGMTIPSGLPSLAFGAGTYTVYSGTYIYAAGLTEPGALLSVSYAAATAGQLQYSATWADSVVAIVQEYNSTTGALTFTTQMF